MQKRIYINVFLFAFCLSGIAQNNRFHFPVMKEMLPAKETTFRFFKNKPQLQTPCPIIMTGKKQKLPVFCRMEENLHKKFNVWILLRAGSDEEYRKLKVSN